MHYLCFFFFLFFKLYSHIKKKLAHVAEYVLPHCHDHSHLCRRHMPDQLPSGLPSSKFSVCSSRVKSCGCLLSGLTVSCDRWASPSTTPRCPHCCGSESAPGSSTKRRCGDCRSSRRGRLLLYPRSGQCSGQLAGRSTASHSLALSPA